MANSLEADRWLCDIATPPLRTYPCSAAQRRFWVLDQLSPGDPSLNVAVRWRLEGEVSGKELEAAFRLILGRHEPLRSYFLPVDGEPHQQVVAQVPFHIPTLDLTMLPEAEAQAEAQRIAQGEARASFDLSMAPLIRVTHLRVTPRYSVILVTAHHIVCDGWSIGILARELGEICAARRDGRLPRLPQLHTSYGALAQSSLATDAASAAREEDQAYWKRKLEGVRYFELMPDHPRPPQQTGNGAILSRLLERRLTDQLAAWSRREGCTLFATCLAVLLTLLHRYSGETDICVGTQCAGRDEVEAEDLVGPFINTLLLRGDLSGNPAFSELSQRIAETVLDAYEHQHLPLEKLIEILKPRRDPSRNALYSVNFIWQRSFVENRDYGAFRLVDLPSCPAGALYDLNFFLVERPEGWRLSCEFNQDLFEAATVARMLQHFERLLQAVADAPGLRLSELTLLSEAERAELVDGCNATEAQYPRHVTLPQLIAAQAARTPQAAAVTCGERSLSYVELLRAADAVATRLCARNVPRGSRVGVLLERSVELVAVLLGIHRAGCAYVPLDPSHPPDRLRYVVADAGMSALVSRRPLAAGIADTALPVIDVAEALAASGPAAALVEPAPEDVAYVIYTSGSTGRPKGVQIQHRALVNLLWSMRRAPGLNESDVFLAVTTVSFDIAALELFLPLLVGASVVLATEEQAKDGVALRALLQSHGATVMQATPVTWQLLLEAGWRGDPALKMLCGGEVMPRRLADALLACGGELWNLYGPTETTIWSSALRVQPSRDPVRLGGPIDNTRFYVLDAHGGLAPLGGVGELCIGGDGVALGYLNRPELTAQRFVPDPFHKLPGARMYRTGDMVRLREPGSFEFIGRTDNQVKLRGFRIELGEIEAVLLHDPDVKEAAAHIGVLASGAPAILAYAVPRGPAPPSLQQSLRDALRKALPSYMWPASIMVLAALPRTPNGKLDRNALPAPQAVAPETMLETVASPADEVGRRLAAIWCSLLGLEHVSPKADFFEMGGDSLLVARLLSRIEAEFGLHIRLSALFHAPTLEAQARLLERRDSREYDFRQAVRLHPNGSRLPIIAINNTGFHYYGLAKRLGAEQPLLALQLFDPSMPRRQVPGRIEDIAGEYVRLIRQFQPSGPYRLLGWCVGGVIAFEVARQLRQAGDSVAMLTMIDAWVPGYLQRMPRWRANLAERLYSWQLIVGEWLCAIDSPRKILDFLARRNLVRRMGAWLGRPAAAPEPSGQAGELYDQWLQEQLDRAAKSYVPQAFDGPVTLLRSSREPSGLLLDRAMGWRACSAMPVRVRTIRGDHFSIFQEPGVSEMARWLSDDADGAPPRTRP